MSRLLGWRCRLLAALALGWSGCVNDSTGLAEQDAGSAPDAGATEALGCSLPTVQLAQNVDHNLPQIAPIDLRVFNEQIYVTWIDGGDLTLATLDLAGEVIRYDVLAQVDNGQTPRIFFREGRGPAVIAMHRDLAEPELIWLTVFDTTGASQIAVVEGEMRFGIDAGTPTMAELPPMVIGVRTTDASFLDVLVDEEAFAQRMEIAPSSASHWAIEIASIADGFAVLLGTGGDFEYFTTDAAGLATGPPLRLSDVKSAFAHDFKLRTDEGGRPLAFYPAGGSRMASVGIFNFDDPDAEPMILQKRAGIFQNFGIAVDRGEGGWMVAWSDFRDTFSQNDNNQYVPRNLYFKSLSDVALTNDGTARLLVDGEGRDLNFPQLGHLPDGRHVAAYARGFELESLHVVIGDFGGCPVRPPHSFQD